MKEFILNGESYRDDRMFVFYLCKGKVERRPDGGLDTWIYHEEAPQDFVWCLVTYRNNLRYTAFRVDHFRSVEEAQGYLEATEPTTPLVSLGGREPAAPLPYKDYVKWKRKNRLKEYNYIEMYSIQGGNPWELIFEMPKDGLGRHDRHPGA